jgi:hypothetical protein
MYVTPVARVLGVETLDAKGWSPALIANTLDFDRAVLQQRDNRGDRSQHRRDNCAHDPCRERKLRDGASLMGHDDTPDVAFVDERSQLLHNGVRVSLTDSHVPVAIETILSWERQCSGGEQNMPIARAKPIESTKPKAHTANARAVLV